MLIDYKSKQLMAVNNGTSMAWDDDQS